MTTSLRELDRLDGLGFPEALRWRDGALYFSDMFRSRVMRWVPGSAAEVVLDRAGGGPVTPGGLGWLPDGDLLVVDCDERRVLRLHSSGEVTVHADLSTLMSHSANDMHVDPDGTAWVGGYGFNPETDEPVASPLVRVHPDGSVATTPAGFVFPNGCERTAAGDLLVAETFADTVQRLSPSGERSVRAHFAEGSGPDGLSIAPDGAVYVALAFAGALARLADDTEGVDAAPTIIHRPAPIAEGPGAGALGVYDCAVYPDSTVHPDAAPNGGTRIAVAMASLDEDLAMRVDTGAVVLLEL